MITPRPWDQLGGGHELEREEEHGRGQDLDKGVGNREQGRETINMFSDKDIGWKYFESD